jgi:hypothetical protein
LQLPEAEYPNTFAHIKQKYQNGNINRKLRVSVYII